ncbi:MAG: rimM [Deltaproteobacteria bacterium]|nr:rimM [Deltaproteobacteria bacterium]
MEDTLLWVGRIVKTQGIKGQVRLFASVEGAAGDFPKGTIIYLKDPQGTRKRQVTVASSRVQHPFTILSFQEIQRIEDAQDWVGCSAFICKESLAALPPDEFYAYQLFGLQVKTEQGASLGVLEEIIPTGSNDVFVVRKGGQEILLPATDEVVLRVDVAKKEMTVRLLEGLLPEDDI